MLYLSYLKNIIFSLLLICLIVGVILLVYGLAFQEKEVEIEPHGILWLEPNSVINPNAKRVTWGVKVLPSDIPNFWRINIDLKANGSIGVKSFWSDPSDIMIEFFGKEFNETTDIMVDGNKTEWTFYIDNPNPNFVEVERLIVTYSAFNNPLENFGRSLFNLGISLVLISLIILFIWTIYRFKNSRS